MPTRFRQKKIRRKKKTDPLPTNQAQALRLVYAGARLLDQGQSDGAEAAWREALKHDPQCTPAGKLLTEFLTGGDRMAEVLECLDKQISASPRTAEKLVALGDQCYLAKNYRQSGQLLEEALLKQPAPQVRLRATFLLAAVHCANKDWEGALKRAQEVLDSEPEHVEALIIRQNCWHSLSYVAEAAADCRRIIQRQPNSRTHSDLLFKMNFLSETTPELLYEESCRWNKLYAEPLAAELPPHTNTPEPHRRLKIGYVSPDLRNHPIMRLLPVVFEKFNREHFELFVYSTGRVEDEQTEYVRRTVKNFIKLPPGGHDIAARARADGIDILVDLAGHTMLSDSLLAFARKPAPVQVSWMGVHATTGLTAIDYFLGDAYMPCPGTEHLFSEKVFRLPHAQYAYRPIGAFGDPTPAGSPCFSNGYITFGCFNQPMKITREAVRLWSVILHLTPHSKLLLKYLGLSDEMPQRRLRQWFAENGITGERLAFEDRSLPAEYLASWSKIDIALDPFPYNGGTTTLDALWMGVPVVSQRGRLAVNCCGDSFLSAIGFPVAAGAEEYIQLACNLVKAVQTTPSLRQRVRQALSDSPLMDEQGLMRALENAYREMWRSWCAKQYQAQRISPPG